ncbi:DinB family protein [Nocardioides litoris]|uniref:DinB family protein n=1 Tax=Nocardioides litoris TaxID=1926648 RepID=UPI0011215542|nr:DinB family protein [Nocardioides litoris]
MTWNRRLTDQLTSHWDGQVRPRLVGMTDAEYLWERVPHCWSLRPRGTSTAPVQAGSGAMTIDFAFPEPEPAPVTTIAWRLGHVLVGVLAMRNASHVGGPATDYGSYDYPATAAEALARLDAEVGTWLAGVEALGDDGLERAVGPAEGAFAAEPYAVLVLHIHRELVHHLAEVCLLRDLYAARAGLADHERHPDHAAGARGTVLR